MPQFEDWYERASDKGLPYVKAYLEHRLDIAFILPGTDVAAVCSSLCPRSGELTGKRNVLDKRCNGTEEFVLIGDVEVIEAEKGVVPTWVRFERLNFSDDLFAGQMCFSALHSGYKSLRTRRDQGQAVWKGSFLFDDVGLLVGVRVSDCDEANRTMRQIFPDRRVEVIDVMLCPTDLQQARA
jgi:hypothetical protein